MTKIRRHRGARVVQGDIYTNVDFIEYAVEKKGVVSISKIRFPHVVVLSQDCDLVGDYRVRWSKAKASSQDKKLFSVLVVPLYNAAHFFAGTHLSDLQMTMQSVKKDGTAGKQLQQNETPRYHYCDFPKEVPLVPSVIDFKHYFSVNVEYLKRNRVDKFVCRISPLFREHLSLRFANFLSRVGLPQEVS
jgi:hypothetical protein